MRGLIGECRGRDVGRLVALVAAIAAGAAAATAPAGAASLEHTQLVAAGGQQLGRPYTGWAQRSLVPLPRGQIVVRRASCPGYPRLVACVKTSHPRMIWIRPDTTGDRTVFLHELGHVFDLTALRAADRRAFNRIHGRKGGWFDGTNSPAEWFAGAYALCARHATLTSRARPDGYGYTPTPLRHVASCRLIRQVGVRATPLPQPPVAPPPVVPEPKQPPVASEPKPPPVASPPAERRCFLLFTCPS